jgi:hypothetical protein
MDQTVRCLCHGLTCHSSCAMLSRFLLSMYNSALLYHTSTYVQDPTLYSGTTGLTPQPPAPGEPPSPVTWRRGEMYLPPGMLIASQTPQDWLAFCWTNL